MNEKKIVEIEKAEKSFHCFPVVQVRSSAILTETKFDFFCCPPKKPFRLSLENRFQKNGVKVLQVGIKREAHIKIHYLEQSWKGTMPAKLAELQRNNGNEKREALILMALALDQLPPLRPG